MTRFPASQAGTLVADTCLQGSGAIRPSREVCHAETIYDVGWPAWSVLAAALALWVAFLAFAVRLLFRNRERVRCPIQHRTAVVTFVRGPDGWREDVVRCSLLDSQNVVTCAKQCLQPGVA